MTDIDALARAIRVLIADAAPVLRDGGTPIDRQNLAAAIEQAAEAADREAAGGSPDAAGNSSAAADALDVKRLEEAMYEVAVNQMNLFDWPSAKDVAAAYAAAKDSPSSPDGLDGEAGE